MESIISKKKKIEYMTYRSPEELFDLNKDPGCWNNLAKEPDYAGKLKEYRQKLYKEMNETADPELSVFINFTK